MGLIVGLTFPELEKKDAAPEAAEFVCPVCGKGYKTKSGLDKHLAAEHGPVEDTEETTED